MQVLLRPALTLWKETQKGKEIEMADSHLEPRGSLTALGRSKFPFGYAGPYNRKRTERDI